jgi:hypothetical protein
MGKQRQDWDREEGRRIARLDACKRAAPTREGLGAEVWDRLQRRLPVEGLGDLTGVELERKD